MTSKVRITFLGTSYLMPTAKRNHTSILLDYEKESILIDCGEGTQRQFKKARLNPMRLTRLLITHWHGDHVLGIPGLLQTLAFNDYKKTLCIYGPHGTKKFMNEMLKTFVFTGRIKFEVKEIETGKFFETDDFYLEAERMSHGTPCNAYSFVRKGQTRIDKNKLKKSRLPSGPLLRKLKEGKDVEYNGKKFKAKDLTYVGGKKKISFVLDTSINNRIVSFVKNSDVLVCESSFDSDLSNRAKERNHLTAEQAAKIARDAEAKRLILTHISQRYEKNLKKFLSEAKKVFKKVSIAEDLDGLEI